jgi:hypothetical protein
MFRSTTIIRELALSLAKVMLKHSVNYVVVFDVCVTVHLIDNDEKNQPDATSVELIYDL